MILDNSAFAHLTPCPEPGLHENISNEDYHKIDCPSSSWLKKKNFTPPARLPASLLRPQTEKSEALIMGDALHQLVLEPDRFNKNFVRMPYFGDLRTNAAKEKKSIFEAENLGKVCLKEEDYDSIVAMRDGIFENPEAKQMIEARSGVEVSIIADEEETGVRCRIRMDLVVARNGLVVVSDIKTTAGMADKFEFAKTILGFEYHLSAGMYTHIASRHFGIDVKDFFFIIVEKQYPYFANTLRLSDLLGDDDALGEGVRLMRSRLKTYKQCRESNVWPRYQLDDVSLPDWELRKIQRREFQE